jgi:tetratricopeptide (TPR) repeat protein
MPVAHAARLLHAGVIALLAVLLLPASPRLTPRRAWAAGEQSAALLRQLKEADPELRRNALLGLADQGDFSTVPQVAAALRDRDLVARKLAEQALWSIWSRSGKTEVDDLLHSGSIMLARGQAVASVSVFTQVIERAPDFAEAYNKRATAYYEMGEYEKSLKDIDETLKRNPYHFGALSGAGLCLVELERFDDALGYFERALKINPNMEGIVQLKRALLKRRKKTEI